MPPAKRLPQSEPATRSLLDIGGLVHKFLNNFVSNVVRLMYYIIDCCNTVCNIMLVLSQSGSMNLLLQNEYDQAYTHSSPVARFCSCQ